MDFSPALEQLTAMVNTAIALLPNIVIGLLIFWLAWLLARVLKGLVWRFTVERRRQRTLGLALGRITFGGVLLLGALLALTIIVPSFSPGDLIGALGISGVIIGFAFRDIFQNFLAGLIILFTEPFRIEDQIVYQGFEGTVEDIQTRATAIRTYDGRRVLIPNAELFTHAVTVNTAFDRRRLEYNLGIGYGDNIGHARVLILQAIRGVDGVLLDPPPDVLVVGLAESSVTIRVRWWIQPPRRADALDLQDRVLQTIKETLSAHGIDLPFPTYQVLFHDQTEETDGDRARQREGWPAGQTAVPRSRSIASVLTHSPGNENVRDRRAPGQRQEERQR